MNQPSGVWLDIAASMCFTERRWFDLEPDFLLRRRIAKIVKRRKENEQIPKTNSKEP